MTPFVRTSESIRGNVISKTCYHGLPRTAGKFARRQQQGAYSHHRQPGVAPAMAAEEPRVAWQIAVGGCSKLQGIENT